MKIGFMDRRRLVFIVALTVFLFVNPSHGISQTVKDVSRKAKVPAEEINVNNDSSDSTLALIHSLPITLHPQETENWCWAACGQMVMEYLGRTVSQCEQANNRYNRTECCTNDLSPLRIGLLRNDSSIHAYISCARPGWPEFGKYGFAYKRKSNAALTWNEIKAQLSNGPTSKAKPVAFSWRWNRGGGHLMIAKGYATVDGENYVIVLDPWPVNKGDEVIIPYSAYVEDPGKYTHWDDFYNIEISFAN